MTSANNLPVLEIIFITLPNTDRESKCPTLTIFTDGEEYFLVDEEMDLFKKALLNTIPHLGKSHHRVLLLQVEVRKGNMDDAITYSLANQLPSARRRNKKRRFTN